MMNSNRKQFLRAFFLSMALTSGVVTAQMAPAGTVKLAVERLGV